MSAAATQSLTTAKRGFGPRRQTALTLGLTLVITLAGSAAAGQPALNSPSYGEGWRPLTPIAGGPRQEHSVAAVNGRVYVIGGIYPDA